MIKIIKNQYDSYSVYDNNTEVAYIVCSNYYSAYSPEFRRWHIRVDFGKGENYDSMEYGLISEVKQKALKFYDECCIKHTEWMKELKALSE